MSYSETSLLSKQLEKYNSVITIKTSIGNVPLYKMIEKFLYIENTDGQKVRFFLNEDQVDLYREMCEQRLRNEPIRLDILKARQKGFSTFISAVIFCMTIFQVGQKAAIVADIAEHATNLFEKYKFFYDNLPPELKPTQKKSNAKELVVQYANGQTSSIRIMVQGDSAGRSGTYQFLHLSECAFWGDLQDTLVSLLQTVSATNKQSMVFLETTANGVNEYKTRWDKDFAGGTSYVPKFYGWFTTKRYRVSDEDLRPYTKPLWLIELQTEHNLDENQCAWYYDRFNDFNGDLEKLRQEYPSNPVEAFVTSGNSVFNTELTAKRKLEILKAPKPLTGMFTFTLNCSADGKRKELLNIEFIESRSGSVKIYREPEQGHPYVVSNDPAMGGEDYFATQVFDNYTGEQVAVYHRNKCDADDAAYQTFCLAKKYNDALITGETNTTSYILESCYKLGHRFIYKDQDVEDLSGRYMNKFGYKTKINNRTYMIDLAKIAFRDNPQCINDYETICEMEAFQLVAHANGKEKAEASGGKHDDLVMAMCGFHLCRNAQTTVVNVAKRNENVKMITDPYEIYKRHQNQDERNVYQIWD